MFNFGSCNAKPIFQQSIKRDLATKGFAFGNHKLLEKLDENFYFCLHKLGAAR